MGPVPFAENLHEATGIYRRVVRYIAENKTRHNHRCENLKSHRPVIRKMLSFGWFKTI